VIGNGSTVARGAGRPAVPQDSLEVILDTFVKYRNDLRKKRVTYRPKSHFFAAMQHTDTWWRKYAKDNYLHFWPLLPESDNVLVAVIFGQPDYWITWANDALCKTLGYARDELVDTRSALELLRGPSARLSAEENRALDDLRAHPGTALSLDRTYLIDHEGNHLPIRLELHYTGPKQERFLAIAEVLEEVDADVFNVDQRTLFDLYERFIPPYRFPDDETK
jgi:PAS domain-containing protein